VLGESAGLGEVDHITDFNATVGNEDVLDISDLLAGGTFGGTTLADAVAGGYVTIDTSDLTNTVITVDLTGSGDGAQTDYTVVLDNTLEDVLSLTNNVVVD